ncbi:MAG: tRNA (adenosine(37)-N6)-threonylcarbamoyltransferase complex ATPase subunit type 1 TsaE [Actinomycetota bacterium]
MTAGPISLVTRSPDETRDVGAEVAGLLGAGDVVSLTGDLGAGKTCLVQGAARALGVPEPVSSPTFVLIKEYRGELPVYHVDVYRLDRIQDVLDLGFEDLLDPSGVVFVEWGSAIDVLLPDTHLEIGLTILDDETRGVDIIGRGPGWAGRWARLEERLGHWRAA